MNDFEAAKTQRVERSISDMTGPQIEGCAVFIDGRKVPNMAMLDRVGGEITFVLDGRMAFSFPREIAVLAASFAASAMAIGAGYGSIAQCDNKPPFAPKVMKIDLGGGDD